MQSVREARREMSFVNLINTRTHRHASDKSKENYPIEWRKIEPTTNEQTNREKCLWCLHGNGTHDMGIITSHWFENFSFTQNRHRGVEPLHGGSRFALGSHENCTSHLSRKPYPTERNNHSLRLDRSQRSSLTSVRRLGKDMVEP